MLQDADMNPARPRPRALEHGAPGFSPRPAPACTARLWRSRHQASRAIAAAAGSGSAVGMGWGWAGTVAQWLVAVGHFDSSELHARAGKLQRFQVGNCQRDRQLTCSHRAAHHARNYPRRTAAAAACSIDQARGGWVATAARAGWHVAQRAAGGLKRARDGRRAGERCGHSFTCLAHLRAVGGRCLVWDLAWDLGSGKAWDRWHWAVR